MFISPARQLCMQVKQAADAGVKKVLKWLAKAYILYTTTYKYRFYLQDLVVIS